MDLDTRPHRRCSRTESSKYHRLQHELVERTGSAYQHTRMAEAVYPSSQENIHKRRHHYRHSFSARNDSDPCRPRSHPNSCNFLNLSKCTSMRLRHVDDIGRRARGFALTCAYVPKKARLPWCLIATSHPPHSVLLPLNHSATHLTPGRQLHIQTLDILHLILRHTPT
jgi:hypothetical protein